MNVSRKLLVGLVAVLALAGTGAASAQPSADSGDKQVIAGVNHWCC